MKRTLFLWLALGSHHNRFHPIPRWHHRASAVQTGQTKNKGESIIYKGNTPHTTGKMVKTGRKAPDFHLTQSDLQDVKLSDLKGKKVILNVFPSLDTPTCAVSPPYYEFNDLGTSGKQSRALHIQPVCPSHNHGSVPPKGLPASYRFRPSEARILPQTTVYRLQTAP